MARGRIARRATAVLLAAAAVGVSGTANAAPERLLVLSGSANGSVTRVVAQPRAGSVQLLTGFDLSYQGGTDGHIATVGARPLPGTFSIRFADKSFDDPMTYRVNLTNIALPGTITPPTLSRICGGGRCNFALQQPPSDLYIFVLRGFQFSFDGNDHHFRDAEITQTEIARTGEKIVNVAFADKNGDDLYRVNLDYAWVPRSLIAGFVSSGRTVSDTGAVRVPVRGATAGNKAITGFKISYNDTPGPTNPPRPVRRDEHLKRFGYMLTNSGLEVYFQDKNPADSPPWTFRVQYVRFR